MKRRKPRGFFAISAFLLLLASQVSWAAVNSATAGIDGLNNGTIAGGDGTGEARIELFSVQLALSKQARDLAGTVLSDGTAVAPGQDLYFVLLVDNPADVPAVDLRLLDAIDELQFTYLPGTLEQTLVPSGSSDASIWAGGWAPQSDGIGLPDDYASAVDSGGDPGADRITVGIEPSQSNLRVDVPAGTVLAIRFRVRVN